MQCERKVALKTRNDNLLACLRARESNVPLETICRDTYPFCPLSLGWLVTVTYIFLGHIKQNVKGSQQAHLTKEEKKHHKMEVLAGCHV